MTHLLPLLDQIRSCRECEPHLPHGTRPVLQAGVYAKILIIGQAPGRRVHESGIPWDDASGNRLRDWLGITHSEFYNQQLVALVPMGFCYPGTGSSGDLPPRPECAPLWHQKLLKQLPNIRLTLLIGRYAQQQYPKNTQGDTLTATVSQWKEYAPDTFPLPHPSPRNNRWLKQNEWFGEELIPVLRIRTQRAIKSRSS